MKTPHIIKIFGYVSELNKRNFKVYLKPVLKPTPEPIVKNSIHWVGHATTIINIEDILILTDPVIVNWLGHLKRLVYPSIDIKSLHSDYVLLSHGHMDHINYESIKKVNKDCIFIVPKPFVKKIEALGFKKVIGIDAKDNSYQDSNIKIKAVVANHDGCRTSFGKYADSFSYIINRKEKKVFFAGDTAFTKSYTNIEADAAIMPVGCYKPDEFQKMHCTPEQSFQMFKMMKAKIMIPVHYKTFILSQDNDGDTHNTLQKINDGSIKIIDIGQTVNI